MMFLGAMMKFDNDDVNDDSDDNDDDDSDEADRSHCVLAELQRNTFGEQGPPESDG